MANTYPQHWRAIGQLTLWTTLATTALGAMYGASAFMSQSESILALAHIEYAAQSGALVGAAYGVVLGLVIGICLTQLLPRFSETHPNHDAQVRPAMVIGIVAALATSMVLFVPVLLVGGIDDTRLMLTVPLLNASILGMAGAWYYLETINRKPKSLAHA